MLFRLRDERSEHGTTYLAGRGAVSRGVFARDAAGVRLPPHRRGILQRRAGVRAGGARVAVAIQRQRLRRGFILQRAGAREQPRGRARRNRARARARRPRRDHRAQLRLRVGRPLRHPLAAIHPQTARKTIRKIDRPRPRIHRHPATHHRAKTAPDNETAKRPRRSHFVRQRNLPRTPRKSRHCNMGKPRQAPPLGQYSPQTKNPNPRRGRRKRTQHAHAHYSCV